MPCFIFYAIICYILSKRGKGWMSEGAAQSRKGGLDIITTFFRRVLVGRFTYSDGPESRLIYKSLNSMFQD